MKRVVNGRKRFPIDQSGEWVSMLIFCLDVLSFDLLILNANAHIMVSCFNLISPSGTAAACCNIYRCGPFNIFRNPWNLSSSSYRSLFDKFESYSMYQVNSRANFSSTIYSASEDSKETVDCLVLLHDTGEPLNVARNSAVYCLVFKSPVQKESQYTTTPFLYDFLHDMNPLFGADERKRRISFIINICKPAELILRYQDGTCRVWANGQLIKQIHGMVELQGIGFLWMLPKIVG